MLRRGHCVVRRAQKDPCSRSVWALHRFSRGTHHYAASPARDPSWRQVSTRLLLLLCSGNCWRIYQTESTGSVAYLPFLAGVIK